MLCFLPLEFLFGFSIHSFSVSVFSFKFLNILIIAALKLLSAHFNVWDILGLVSIDTFFWSWFWVTLFCFFPCTVIVKIVIWILTVTHCRALYFCFVEACWIHSSRERTCLNSNSNPCPSRISSYSNSHSVLSVFSCCIFVGSPGNPPAYVYLAVHQRFGRTYGRFWCSLLSGSPSSRIPPSLSRWSALSHKWIGECPFAKRCKFINLTTAFLCFKCRVSFTDCFWNILSRFYNCFLEDGPTNLLSTTTGSGPSFWDHLKMKFFIFIWSYMKLYEGIWSSSYNTLHITLFYRYNCHNQHHQQQQQHLLFV